MKTGSRAETPRRPHLLAAALLGLLGCGALAGPEDRVEDFLRAAYDGDGLAIQDMLLMGSLKGDKVFLPTDAWYAHLVSAQGEGDGETEITPEQAQAFREEGDAHVAKASLDLVERGPLEAVESELVERNGDWACVEAKYRFGDGTALARDQYPEEGKFATAARFAPDGYYFLNRRDGRWYVLDSVPDFAARRFSVTAAGSLLEAVIEGDAAAAREIVAVAAPGQTGGPDPLAGLAERPSGEADPLDGWSLQFRGRRENERVTVVSFEVRVADAEQKVQTEEVAVSLRLRGGLWEVDRADAGAAAKAVGRLGDRLEGIRQAKAERELEAERQALLQPVVLLDQVRSIRSGRPSPGMDHTFQATGAGRLRLEVQVLDGVPVNVELMPPEEYHALRSASREYRSYTAFRGEGVIRQSFEMPVTVGTAYVLFIEPNAPGEESRVELKYWFLPEDKTPSG